MELERQESCAGMQGWRSGESTRLPPMWPGFDSQTRCHMWVEFVGSLSRGGLMVSVLHSGSSGPGSDPGRGHCVVFFGQDTLLLRCLSPARCINGYRRI